MAQRSKDSSLFPALIAFLQTDDILNSGQFRISVAQAYVKALEGDINGAVLDAIQ